MTKQHFTCLPFLIQEITKKCLLTYTCGSIWSALTPTEDWCDPWPRLLGNGVSCPYTGPLHYTLFSSTLHCSEVQFCV